MRISCFITLLFVTASVFAGQVTVPNTFVSGTTAVAADVNENFDTLADGVNINDANIVINSDGISTNANAISALQATAPIRVVDGNGTDLGRLLDHSGKYITYQTNTGYVVPFMYLVDGRLYDANGNWVIYYYELPGCAGTPYVGDLSNGVVFTGHGAVSFTDMNDAGSNINVQSNKAPDGNCQSFATISMTNMFAVVPNNQAVTGYSGSTPLPIRIK